MVWLNTHTREISRFSNAWFKTQGCFRWQTATLIHPRLSTIPASEHAAAFMAALTSGGDGEGGSGGCERVHHNRAHGDISAQNTHLKT
jgi:hypothetical protein